MLTTAGAPLSGLLRGRGGVDAGLLHTVVSEPGAAAVTRGHRELPTVHRHSCETLTVGTLSYQLPRISSRVPPSLAAREGGGGVVTGAESVRNFRNLLLG